MLMLSLIELSRQGPPAELAQPLVWAGHTNDCPICSCGKEQMVLACDPAGFKNGGML